MNGLRLTLLVIGLVILAAIYWWGTASQKGNRWKRFTRRRRREQPPLDALPLSLEREEGVDYTRTLADLNELMVERRDGRSSQSPIGRALRRGRERLTQPAIDAAPPDPKADKAPEPEKILTLFLTAPAGESYRGVAVWGAAEAVGLRYGDMGVFHHYGLAGIPSQAKSFLPCQYA